jgi:hypothetical protein
MAINIPRNITRSISSFATTLKPIRNISNAVTSIQNVPALVRGNIAQAQGFYNSVSQQARALAGGPVAALTLAQSTANSVQAIVPNIANIVNNPIGNLGSAVNSLGSKIDTSVLGNIKNITDGASSSDIASSIGNATVTNFTPAQADATQASSISGRPWIPKSPLTDRYDFNKGQKVFNMLGDGPAGSAGGSGPRQGGGTVNIKGGESAQTQSNATGSAGNVLQGASVDSTGVIGKNPSIGYDAGQVDPALYAAGINKSNSGYNKKRGWYVNTDYRGADRLDGIVYHSTHPLSPMQEKNTWSDNDVRSVEKLKSFNDDIGGGAALSKLSPNEKAYARAAGYINEAGT